MNGKSIVTSIKFDVNIDGIGEKKGVVLKYKKRDKLCLCELFYEDNDSWNSFNVNGFEFDIQITGHDDSTLGDIEFDFDKASKGRHLTAQLNMCQEDKDGDYEPTNQWYCYKEDFTISNCIITTEEGDIAIEFGEDDEVPTINEIEANKMLGQLLDKENIGDKVYELAQDLFTQYVNKIETQNKVVSVDGDMFDFSEAWYDEIREDFFADVYNRINKFLNKE